VTDEDGSKTAVAATKTAVSEKTGEISLNISEFGMQLKIIRPL
jgi:hypothetical protein